MQTESREPQGDRSVSVPAKHQPLPLTGREGSRLQKLRPLRKGSNVRPSLWVYGVNETQGALLTPNQLLQTHNNDPVILYCQSPRHTPPALFEDPRVAALVCPTASPFSHDANLLRDLASRRGIAAVYGLSCIDLNNVLGEVISILPSLHLVRTKNLEIKAAVDLSGSDEAIGILLSGSETCYRPLYLYDQWLGPLIASGLESGVGQWIVGPQSKATIDADGRVWLKYGPLPKVLASWIIANGIRYLSILKTLNHSLERLNTTNWPGSTILLNEQFLEAFRRNCQIAPLVGFPLFSLTTQIFAICQQDNTVIELKSRIEETSRLLSPQERQFGTISHATHAAISGYLSMAAERTRSDHSVIDLAASVILLSDARRITIDHLRRNYPAFGRHMSHRKIRQ